jgi:hypothetical protein
MAYFQDLSPYSYHQSGVRPGTQNIGWLEAKHRFPKGTVPVLFLRKLWKLCKVPIVQTRGFHVCEFCNMPTNEVPKLEFENEILNLGSAEIRAFHPDGQIYAAPNLIFHYVRSHSYQPPSVFIQAVMTGPDPETKDYAEKLRIAGFLRK